MGIFCSSCKEEDKDLDLIESTKEEFDFPTYYSKGDSILESLKENNLFKNITLIEYINLLSNINLENSNIPFDGPFKMNFSYYDAKSFINSQISDELYLDFITKSLLSHRMMGEKEIIFRDIYFEIYKNLKNKLKEHYNNDNAEITKKDLISLGLLFCRGTNTYKIKLIFDLFKNEKNELEQNQIFDEFLLCNFLTASYCLINTKNDLSRNNPMVSEIQEENLDKFIQIYNLENCENLVNYFNLNFFNGMKLTFYEYKLKFKDINGFGWIFSQKGIRQKLEENQFFE